MRTASALVAVGLAVQQAAAHGHGWVGADSYSCPSNTDNHCSPEQDSGFKWSGLHSGSSVNHYNNFDFKGYTCQDSFGNSKRDVLLSRGIQSKCITGTASKDHDSSPSFSCSDSSFSIDHVQVSTEEDQDLEFVYGYKNGGTCKHRASCSKSGSTIKNTQCGGADSVTVNVPRDSPKDTCSYGIHSIGFNCGSASVPIPSSTVVPVVSTYASVPIYTVPANTTGAVTPTAPSSYPTAPVSTPGCSPGHYDCSTIPIYSYSSPVFSYSSPIGTAPVSSYVPATSPSVPASYPVSSETSVVPTSAESTPSSPGTYSVQSYPASSGSSVVPTSPESTPSTPATYPAQSYPVSSGSSVVPTYPASSVPATYPASSPSSPASYPAQSYPVSSPSSPATYPAQSYPVKSSSSPATYPAQSYPVESSSIATHPAQSYPVESSSIATYPVKSSSIASYPVKSYPVETPSSPASYPIKSYPTETPSSPASYPVKSYPAGSSVPVTSSLGNSPTEASSYGPEVTKSAYTTPVPVVPVPITSENSPIPVVSSSSAPSASCPTVLPQCLNTWIKLTTCENNAASDCYCTNAEFTKNVQDCVSSWAYDDSEIQAALSYLAGICASHVSANPGIVTHVPKTITLIPTPATSSYPTATPVPAGQSGVTAGPIAGETTPAPANYQPSTVITCQITTEVAATYSSGPSAGSTIPSSSVTTVTNTAVTVPQVQFTTGNSPVGATGAPSVGLAAGSPSPVIASSTPAAAGYGAVGATGGPTGATTFASVKTSPTAATSPIAFQGAATKAGSGVFGLIAAGLLSLIVLV